MTDSEPFAYTCPLCPFSFVGRNLWAFDRAIAVHDHLEHGAPLHGGDGVVPTDPPQPPSGETP